jgi:uncharacterized protein (TIGR03435 family)
MATMAAKFAIELACIAAFASAQAQPSFEVASVRPSNPAEPMAFRGGPGTSDPTQITYTGAPLPTLIVKAYTDWDGVHPQSALSYRIVGLPPVAAPFYDIRARVPPAATPQDLGLMLQNLLAERFSLRVHHENRDVPGYRLVIAKGGPKLKPPEKSAVPLPEGALDEAGENRDIRTDRNGNPQLAPGRKGRVLTGLVSGNRFTARMQSITDIVAMCRMWTGRPIEDETGLKGIYDFDLDFAALVAPDGRDDSTLLPFEFALAQQLGLKLEPKKFSYDVVVIDHIEKVPTEN